jgi:biopolymer transport protein ExbD
MARREKKKQEVSLFPFLDILACVIGNLILIITAVVLEQVDTKPIAEAAERESQKKQIEKDLQTITLLQKQLEKLQQENQSSDKRVQEAKARLEKAEKDKLAAKKRRLEVPPPPPPPDKEALASVKKRQLEIEELIKEIKEVEGKIAERKKEPEQSITIMPANRGGGIAREPIFVEVNSEGVVIQPDEKNFKKVFGDEKPRPIPVDKVAGDADFKKLLAHALTDKRAIITFLLRPDAVDNYNKVRGVVVGFEKQNQNKLVEAILPSGDKILRSLSGKVPLPGEGVLDFSKAN